MSPTRSSAGPSPENGGSGSCAFSSTSRANRWNVPRKNANGLSAIRATLKRRSSALRRAKGRLKSMNSWMASRMASFYPFHRRERREHRVVDDLPKNGGRWYGWGTSPGTLGKEARRWPRRGAPGGDLLLEGPRGPHALDAATARRRTGASRPGHPGVRGDGPQGAKKNELQPWRKECWCVPERDHARFVAQMEDVLDLYTQAHPDDEPLICMDEASRQLLRDLADTLPIPMAPGRPRREDHHYERRGTQALFMFFDPVRGWRRVAATDSRTRVDWAEQVRVLLDVDYPKARRVKLVCDNLNTHSI